MISEPNSNNSIPDKTLKPGDYDKRNPKKGGQFNSNVSIDLEEKNTAKSNSKTSPKPSKN